MGEAVPQVLPPGLLKTISLVSLRTVLCHITSQHEMKGSSRLARYALNTLRPSFVLVSKVGLRILPLSWSDPFLSKFPPFMLDALEVVDSPVESLKCVAT
jgi:hypothetical protein